jgi:enoyl-CoA hydratase/carnithine racemase
MIARTETRLEIADGIATLTLDRPDRLNAFTGTMANEILAAFDETDADDAVRAVIVTGAGRAFCAGADLSAGAATFDYDQRSDPHNSRAGLGSPVRADGSIDYAHDAVRDSGGKVTLRIFESLKPVIAAVNGPAVGIGATMLLAMDMRLASDTARFGFVFARRGIVPEACSSWFLPRLVGIAQAMEWCVTGRIFDAAEAQSGRLVSRILPADDLLPAANALAREIADNTAPVSVALTRQMLWRMLGADHPMEAHRVDSRAIYSRGRTADAKEGVVSFLEKRAPAFPDRISTDMPDFYPWWSPRDYV